jgi:sigma-B regulation protein RsbU (phosphoserine phosphatase)
LALNPRRKTEILKKCHFLANADDEILAALADESQIQEITRGETVVTKNEAGSTMYFIASGQVRVHDDDVILSYLSEGEVFGEMAVLDSEVRSASVTAEVDSSVLCLERDVLWKTVYQSPAALKSIISSVMERERNIVRDVTTRTEQLLAYEKELEIGRRIQADFLPELVPEIEGWEITPYFEAAREVAGDFYDAFELKQGKNLAIVIGDVCDKGVGAALFMTLFRSLIRASCQFGLADQKPGNEAETPDYTRNILLKSLGLTNSYIAETHSQSSMFASVFFGVLDYESGELSYINAGHESPVIFRENGDMEHLELTGGIVGMFPWATFSIATTQINPGDLIYCYTDGVNEAKNDQGEQFEEKRIYEMNEFAWPDGQGFVDEIIQRVRSFRGDAPQSDDITMLVLRSAAANKPV